MKQRFLFLTEAAQLIRAKGLDLFPTRSVHAAAPHSRSVQELDLIEKIKRSLLETRAGDNEF
jgi:hypothetical protein